MIRFDNVIYVCDGEEDTTYGGKRRTYPCTSKAGGTATFHDGVLKVADTPAEWQNEGGKLYCARCVEDKTLKRIQAGLPLPDPEEDTPIVQKHREQVRVMEKALAEDRLILDDMKEQEFATNKWGGRTTATVLSDHQVKVTDDSGMEILLNYRRSEYGRATIVGVPAFLAGGDLVKWLEGCLYTMPRPKDDTTLAIEKALKDEGINPNL